MRVISLFSGAGGMDLGFLLAGHEIVWANDFDLDAVETYKYNLGKIVGDHIIYGDITKILEDKSYIENEIPDADIVIGGFPCQGFSIANINRSMEDGRNFLYLELLKVISHKQVPFFLLENVKGLENMENGSVLNLILNDLENAGVNQGGPGYKVIYNVLNACNFGVPQNRERVVIFGIRNDLTNNFDIPESKKSNYKDIRKRLHVEPTHSKTSIIKNKIPPFQDINELYSKWLNGSLDFSKNYFKKSSEIYSYNTVRDAISDLPLEFSHTISELNNHIGSICKVKINGMVGNRATKWDCVSPTIMGRGSGTGGPLIIPHPELHRRMSVREVARIQTFPDKFIFKGSVSACYRQIGNAVPVLMAYHIARIFPLKYNPF